MGQWGVGGSQEEVSREFGAVSMREGKETRMEGAALGLPHRPLVPSRTVSGYSQGQKLHRTWLNNSWRQEISG